MINNQQRVENRRNWKGQVVDYDAIKDYEERECLYCLTDAQIAVLAGFIEPLAWTTRWQSNTQEIDPVWTANFYNDITRRLQMSCCGDESPIRYRYTEDGVLESSSDDGLTWEPAPNSDIRNTATIFPPIPGEPSDDKKCIAATGMSNLIKQQVGDQLTDDMARYTLNELLQDWTSTYIGTSNPFTAILTVAANQIFALAIALLIPALTNEVYDTLQCIFYCRISDDLTFDSGSAEQVRQDIGSKIEGIATLFLQQLVFLLGSAGLTNLARSMGATEGNCDACTDCSDCVILYDPIAPGVPLVPNDECEINIEAQLFAGVYRIYVWPNDTGLPQADALFQFTYEDKGGAINFGYYDADTNPHVGQAPYGVPISGLYYERNMPMTVGLVVMKP